MKLFFVFIFVLLLQGHAFDSDEVGRGKGNHHLVISVPSRVALQAAVLKKVREIAGQGGIISALHLYHILQTSEPAELDLTVSYDTFLHFLHTQNPPWRTDAAPIRSKKDTDIISDAVKNNRIRADYVKMRRELEESQDTIFLHIDETFCHETHCLNASLHRSTWPFKTNSKAGAFAFSLAGQKMDCCIQECMMVWIRELHVALSQ